MFKWLPVLNRKGDATDFVKQDIPDLASINEQLAEKASQNDLDKITTQRLKSVGSLAEFTTGDGIADDTQALINAVNTYKTVLIPPPAVKYRISHIDFNSLTGIKLIGIGNPKIVGTDNTKVILQFNNCTSVKLEGFQIGYDTTPTARVDNLQPISFYKCNFTKVIGVETFNSLSIGIIHVYCNNAIVDKCYVHNTMADGINFSHCGRNIQATFNTIEDTGDDGIACYFFQNADPTQVGETDKFTKKPIINSNQISRAKARGITLGGTQGAIVSNNTINQTQSYGITAHYEASTSGVNYNQDGIIQGNTILNAGTYGTDTTYNGQRSGIYIADYNVNIDIKNNKVENPQGEGIMCLGSANIDSNHILGSTEGIFAGNYNNASLSFGNIKNNVIESASGHALNFTPPRAVSRGWLVKGNDIIDCVAIGTASSVCYVGNSGAIQFIDNTLLDTRSNTSATVFFSLANVGGVVFDGNEMMISGGFSNGWVSTSSASYITPRSGTTRPTNYPVGDSFYDKNLNKPIWYKGSSVWVDSSGIAV